MEDITSLSALLPNFLVEMLVAIACGGLIGLERGMHHRTAGLRDNILICLGAVLFMKVSELLSLRYTGIATGDPGRIAAQVVTGIGFIGAGVIISRRGDPGGVTTAATIWVVAAIGLTIGAGYPMLGMLVTGAVLITLILLGWIERSVSRRPRPLLLHVAAREDSPELRARLQEVLKENGVIQEAMRADIGPTGVKLTIRGSGGPEDPRSMMATIWTLPGVTEVER